MNNSSGSPKWLRLVSGLALAGSMAACSGNLAPGDEEFPPDETDPGGTGGGTSSAGKAGGGGTVPMPDKSSLERIPDAPLKCSDPNGLNLAPTPFARLTNLQYANAVQDLLSPVTIDAATLKLKAETIRDGFTNNADAQVTVADQIEAFDKVGLAVGTAVSTGLDKLAPSLKIDGACPPKAGAAPAVCGAAFIDAFGAKAYRRPLADDEKTRLKKLFDESVTKWGFADAINAVAAAITQAPQFLYKIEIGGTKDKNGNFKLSGFEVASRLSFLIWNSLPDDALLAAAKSGALDTPAGVEKEAKRLLLSGDGKRAVASAKDFVTQWYDMGKLGIGLGTKDANLFKTYSNTVAKGLVDGLDAYVANTLTGPGGNLEKFFTSTDGWVNKDTAAIYGVTAPTLATGELVGKVALNKDQRLGFLTQPAVLAGLAHGQFQAPVLRGVFIKKEILCQPPGPPDPAADTTPLAVAPNSAPQTYRQVTTDFFKAKGGTCLACHNIINPPGYLSENYNAIGQWQDKENNLPVDASGTIRGTLDLDGEYKSVREFAPKVAKSSQVTQCFVQYFYRYGLGRSLDDADGCHIASITDQVIAAKGDFQTLTLALVKTNAFLYRSPIVQ